MTYRDPNKHNEYRSWLSPVLECLVWLKVVGCENPDWHVVVQFLFITPRVVSLINWTLSSFKFIQLHCCSIIWFSSNSKSPPYLAPIFIFPLSSTFFSVSVRLSSSESPSKKSFLHSESDSQSESLIPPPRSLPPSSSHLSLHKSTHTLLSSLVVRHLASHKYFTVHLWES